MCCSVLRVLHEHAIGIFIAAAFRIAACGAENIYLCTVVKDAFTQRAALRGLLANDMEKMIRFYRDVLGFEVREAEDTENVYLVKDRTLLLLYSRKDRIRSIR